MPIYYKIDVLAELKKLGFSQNTMRQEACISSSAIDAFAHDRGVSFDTLNKVCALLNLQPGDVLGYMTREQYKEYTQKKMEDEQDYRKKRDAELRIALMEIKNVP